ncbi:hypothetical protein DFP73DRAFT_569350 [Morchella snyderi]|nr:hypothetical protein DFP73DRAFT_569350 [Morchella snyderi]
MYRPFRLLVRDKKETTKKSKVPGRIKKLFTSATFLVQHWAIEVGEGDDVVRFELQYDGGSNMTVTKTREGRDHFVRAPLGFQTLFSGYTTKSIAEIKAKGQEIIRLNPIYCLGTLDCQYFAFKMFEELAKDDLHLFSINLIEKVLKHTLSRRVSMVLTTLFERSGLLTNIHGHRKFGFSNMGNEMVERWKRLERCKEEKRRLIGY